MSRGKRLLWAVPVLFALQALLVALPGDNVSSGGTRALLFWFLVVVVLTWAAAERRSAVAWGLLVVVEVAIVLLTAGLADGYESVTTPYLMLSLLAVGLLLWPATRAHVASST